MIKVIANVEYDTDSAELIGKRTYGSLGDPKGYEECLFKTSEGKYFLYTNGGSESPYRREGIKRFSVLRAEAWLGDIE